jgi:hypothetical protein
MKILRATDHRRMPWKNGAGTTTEIVVFPANAGLDDFDWRVSMARVDGDGPFSSFPGIDRTLAILEGEGIFLAVDGQPPIGLTAQSEPFPFPADVPTAASLIGGPIVDLNVMSRRGRITQRVERWQLAEGQTVEFPAGDAWTILLCHRGRLATSIGGAASSVLSAGDAAVADSTDRSIALKSEGSSGFFAISFSHLA